MAEPAPQPSFRQRLADVFHPLKRPGGYALPHVLILAVILLVVAFLAGWFAGEHLSPQSQRLADKWAPVIKKENIRVPDRLVAAPSQVYVAPTLNHNHVPFNTMDVPGNQGYVGSCQCWTFSRLYDQLYFQSTGRHTHFSCLFWYPQTQNPPGSDNGSYFEQYVQLVASVGGVSRKTYDWTGYPQGVPVTIPADIYTKALPHRYTVAETSIASSPGGMNAVYGAMDAIDKGKQVNFDAPVFEGVGANSYFDVTHTHACVDVPASGVSMVGGHATSLYAYTQNDPASPCTRCYFRAENQWGRAEWGIGRSGRTNTTNAGYYEVSCNFAANYGFGIATIDHTDIKPTAARRPIWKQPSSSTHRLAPPPAKWVVKPVPVGTPLPKAIRSYWWVKGFKAADNPRINLGYLIDHWGKVYHVRPAGIAATIFSECGGKTDDPWLNRPQPCDRYGYGADVSHGSCQLTDQTAMGMRPWLRSDYYVKKYEDKASQCVRLMAQLYAQMLNYERSVGCPLTFPDADVAYNAGPYQPCWVLHSPSGQAYSNHLAFLGWWNAVNSRYGSARNPVPGDIGPCNGCRRTKPKHDS